MAEPLICVVGSLNMDLVVQTPALPVPGQTVLGGPFATFPGGKGANQAVAAVRAGGRVAMVGCVGSDGYGNALRAGLEREGVDVSGIRTAADAATGVALITVDSTGQNTIIVVPGANAALSEEDIERASSLIRSAEVLLLQLEVPLSIVLSAARMARAAGTRVVLNPAPARPLGRDELALVDVLIPNETEAAQLVSPQGQGSMAREDMAHALREQGPTTVVITLGEEGALVVNPTGFYKQKAFAVRAVDATAAGDAFIGALAVALAEGHSLQEAVRWGAAAGALTVSAYGAQPSLPYRRQIEQMLGSPAS